MRTRLLTCLFPSCLLMCKNKPDILSTCVFKIHLEESMIWLTRSSPTAGTNRFQTLLVARVDVYASILIIWNLLGSGVALFNALTHDSVVGAERFVVCCLVFRRVTRFQFY